MKTIRLMAVALAGGALVGSIYADKVSLEQLPIDLKDKIRAHTGGAQIEDIDRQTRGGQTTYEVAFKKDGQHTELLFDDKGQLMTDAKGVVPDSRKISYNELPEAVKRIVDTRVKSAEINDVDRQVKNGQTTYEIGFKQNNGRQQELVLSEDGRILNDATVSQAAGAPATAATGSAASSTTASTSLAAPVVLATPSRIGLGATPAAVQRTLGIAAGSARIENLERGTYQGQSVYQADFTQDGRRVELQVREDGSILYDPRTLGAKPANRIRWGSATPASSGSRVTLSATQKVDRNSLPVPVQRRLNSYLGNKSVEDIDRGTWQGKTVYEVAFKDDHGKHVELQIDDKGNVVYDPRTNK
jgi:uncharacterized membrane protein YkoI